MVKPFRSQRYLGKRNFPEFGRKVAAWLLDSSLKLVSLDTWYSGSRRVHAEELECFDERFEVLWKETLSKSMVIGERSPRFLNWKFGSYPGRKILVVGIFNQDRTVALGYIASRFVGSSLEIVDFSFPDNKAETDALLTAFIRHARAQRVDSVSVNFLQNTHYQQIFSRWGFFSGKGLHRNIYVFCQDDLWAAVKKPEDWFLTQGDEDI
jgi:hypothetical protein